MAADHRPVVERGLEVKKIGNEILETIGGRAIHPVNVKVGGFYRVPSRAELTPLRERLAHGRDLALQVVELGGRLRLPRPGDALRVRVRQPSRRVPDAGRPHRVRSGARHRRGGLPRPRHRAPRRALHRAARPASWNGASTWSDRWPATACTPPSWHRRPAEAARAAGLGADLPQPLPQHRRAGGRSGARLRHRPRPSSTDYEAPDRPSVDVRAPSRSGPRRDRSSPRSAVSPVRDRRRWAHRRRGDRAPHLAEPGHHRARPVSLRGAPPRPRRRRAAAPGRSDHPQPRPCISCATHFLDLTVERS